MSHHDCGRPFCHAAFGKTKIGKTKVDKTKIDKTKAPSTDGALVTQHQLMPATIARYQWPKNNHNKMITGIGTPKSHNKIPRPIIASLKCS